MDMKLSPFKENSSLVNDNQNFSAIYKAFVLLCSLVRVLNGT